jgi:signal transduction histidine kinase
VKVGARITIATSALVTATLGIYAFFDLRATASERREAVQREAVQVALAVRTSIEAVGADTILGKVEAILEEINWAVTPWQVSFVPAESTDSAAHGPAVPANPPVSPPAAPPAAIDRLRRLQDMPELPLVAEEGDLFIYVVPVRASSPRSPRGFRVAGSLEVARSVAFLDEALADDVLRTLPVLASIVVIVVLAITWLTSSMMSRPIDKLLAGIDDVAQGDLSRVLLSERDDEIGALATRFNEMTTYLRESRAETQRQNEARLELEQRLRQTEKIATIGLFAAEIAHELGTPLNVIAARARTLAKKSGSPEAVQKNADIISQQTARITRIIQQTLDHARHTVGSPGSAPVRLGDLAQSTLALYEGKLATASIQSSLVCDDALPAVMGDPDRLQQVLINLVNNAIAAMPGGGALRVSTCVVTRRRPGLEAAPEQAYAVLEVADTGAGIPADQRDKIFEPFYTLRRSEGGTGLGLAVCYSIVKDHDGWIAIDDAPGGGAVFAVYLPAGSE